MMLAPTAKKSGTTLSKDKPGPPSEKLRVFISYSRADTAIVDELVSGLEFEGSFQVLVDQQIVPACAQFLQRRAITAHQFTNALRADCRVTLLRKNRLQMRR